MPAFKLIVAYPPPTDIAVFEKVYAEEHVPMAVAKLDGKTKIVTTKVAASPQVTPPFHRIAEVYFPSMAALEACAGSPGGQDVIQNAIEISSGGPPVIMIAEEDTATF
jgi:uncharacterized protein (TIGR02118 family)